MLLMKLLCWWGMLLQMQFISIVVATFPYDPLPRAADLAAHRLHIHQSKGKWVAQQNSKIIDAHSIEFSRYDACSPAQAQYQYIFDKISLQKSNTIEGVLSKLQSKVITLAGDSVMDQRFSCLQLLLENNKIPHDNKRINYKHNLENDKLSFVENCDYGEKNSFCWTQDRKKSRDCSCTIVTYVYVPSYNLTVNYLHFFSFRPPRDIFNVQAPARDLMNFPLLIQYLHSSDSLIFNIGVHEEQKSIAEFTMITRYVASLLNDDVLANGGKRRHAWYLTEPVHFNGHYSEWFNHFDPVSCTNSSSRHATDEIVSGIIEKRFPHLSIIDAYHLLADRGDMHPGKNNDCTHWCVHESICLPRWTLIASLFE